MLTNFKLLVKEDMYLDWVSKIVMLGHIKSR